MIVKRAPNVPGDPHLRTLAQALGLGAVAFGTLVTLTPRVFTRLLGVHVGDSPLAISALRSAAIRDAVLGMGLWSAAQHGGNYRPWVLGLGLSDAGDAVATGLALRGGARVPQLFAFAAISLAVAMLDVWLYRQAGRDGSGTSPG